MSFDYFQLLTLEEDRGGSPEADKPMDVDLATQNSFCLQLSPSQSHPTQDSGRESLMMDTLSESFLSSGKSEAGCQHPHPQVQPCV